MGRAGTGRRTAAARQQGERRAVGSGAGPFAAAQVQLQVLRGPRRSARRKASPLVSAKPLAQALEPLQAISRANGASGSVSRPSPRRPSSAWSASACARFGRSTPCQGSGAGCRRHGARPARPGLPGKRCRAGERRRADHRQARLALRLDAEMTPRTPRRTPPGRHPLVTPQREIQARLQGLQQGFSGQLLHRWRIRVVAAGRARGTGRAAPAPGTRPLRRQRRQGRSRAGQPASRRPASRSAPQASARARCHGDVRASPGLRRRQLDGELGRQRVVAAVRLEPQQQPRGQRAHVQRQVRIEPGGRAEHQVAHVVGAGQAPCRGPRPASSRRRTSRFLAAADATQLQVGTVGRLDHAAGAIPRRGRHGACLGGVQATSIELDAADAAVQRLDDTQQAGTG